MQGTKSDTPGHKKSCTGIENWGPEFSAIFFPENFGVFKENKITFILIIQKKRNKKF